MAIARRFPRLAWASWWTWVIEKLTRSRIVHCAIGVDGRVVSVGIFETLVTTEHDYAMLAPGLAAIVTVPINEVDVVTFSPPGLKPPWPSLARWAFSSRIHSDDCVSVTVRVLQAGGVDVPRKVVSPQQLLDFLIGKGCDVVWIERQGQAGNGA